MRQDIERQNELEPKRIEFAKQEIEKLGCEILFENTNQIGFEYEGEIVVLFPYSGWHTGPTIKDGRGLQKLLNKIK